MLVPIPWVHAGLGLISIAVSIPLIGRRIPMNKVYGFRLSQAFKSAHNWYAINAYGGKCLFAFGALLVVFVALAGAAAPPPDSPWAPLYLMTPLIGIVPMILLVKAYAKQLDGR